MTGKAWLDHEWSSDYVDPNSVGWDWIGINLDDGGALMAFRMRGSSKDRAPALGGRDVALGGRQGRDIGPDEIEWTPLRQWRSPRTGVTYPVQWRVRVGTRSYIVEPLMNDAELDSRQSTGTIYWEGPVRRASRRWRWQGSGPGIISN